MLKGLLENSLKLNSLTGVEVYLEKDGQLAVRACTIKLKGQQLSFEQRQGNLKSSLHFAKNFKPGPIALCLRGKGVITKKIDKVQSIDQQVVNQVLPNVNMEHFYFQSYISGEYAFISAIRRSEADELIRQFEEQGFKVLSLSLDAFALQTAMELKDGLLEPELMLSYAAAFPLLLGAVPIEVEHSEIVSARLQAFAKARLIGIGKITGLVLLILLLVNFLLLTYYSGQVSALSAVSSLNTAEIGKLKGQEKDIHKKTMLIKAAGWTGGLNYAYITDRLLGDMPDKIGLQEFSVNPPDEQLSRTLHETVYQTKVVKVTGSCRDAGVLNNWIFAIQANDWVEDCKIMNYEINQDDGSGLFTISIQLKDHEE